MTKFWGVVIKAITIVSVGLLSACMEYHGKVVDGNGSPITGAKLLVTDVMGSEWVTYTNGDGYYFINNLSDYGHDIFASKEGYVTQVYDSQINIFTEVNFVMLNDASDIANQEDGITAENSFNTKNIVTTDEPVNSTGHVELHRMTDGV
ncbi:MAG: carboxypeptidase regulatory-like domain-containing protein [Pseudomonadales bacterium]|nr:carboxypeptidase regulatory-like domain-containing protein [Pseudomonadales bacterium]